jgi:hypothetical protein
MGLVVFGIVCLGWLELVAGRLEAGRPGASVAGRLEAGRPGASVAGRLGAGWPGDEAGGPCDRCRLRVVGGGGVGLGRTED